MPVEPSEKISIIPAIRREERVSLNQKKRQKQQQQKKEEEKGKKVDIRV